MSKRDDFLKPVRDVLARRVGYKCSNPNCRILTTGPGDSAGGTVNVGVAAHITAAAKGGERFDPNLTKEARGSAENGIWLCQIHAKLVDDAPERFTVDLLREWKRLSEQAARLEIEELNKGLPARLAADIEALKVYAGAFDRPAFKDHFKCEMSMSAFDRAIHDTVIVLSTGTLRDREGKLLRQTIGRSALANRSWSEKIGNVIDLLNVIVRRFEIAVSSGAIIIHGRGCDSETYCIEDHELGNWMDVTRSEALKLFSEVLKEAGLDPLPHDSFRRYPRW
jgi:hypothetical protein